MIRRVMIPEDRTAVLIGRGGKVKRALEHKTRTKITIGEEVQIEGDALNVMTAENIVRAVSRGFSPKNAFELLDEDKAVSVIDLPKNKNRLKVIRSRLIGTNGKCRKNIELLTKTKISIYGRTIALIGSHENLELAEDAIRKLIAGITHKNVYAYLESHRINTD